MNFATTQPRPRYDIAADARVLRVPARRLGMVLIGFYHDPSLFNRWKRLDRNRRTLTGFQIRNAPARFILCGRMENRPEPERFSTASKLAIRKRARRSVANDAAGFPKLFTRVFK